MRPCAATNGVDAGQQRVSPTSRSSDGSRRRPNSRSRSIGVIPCAPDRPDDYVHDADDEVDGRPKDEDHPDADRDAPVDLRLAIAVELALRVLWCARHAHDDPNQEDHLHGDKEPNKHAATFARCHGSPPYAVRRRMDRRLPAKGKPSVAEQRWSCPSNKSPDMAERPRSRAGGKRGRRLVAVTRCPVCFGRRVAAFRHQDHAAAGLARELDVHGAWPAGLGAVAPAAEPTLGVGAAGRLPRMPVGALVWRLRDPHREPVRAWDRDEITGSHPPTIVERAFEEKRLLCARNVGGERTLMLDMQVIVRLLDTNEQRLDYRHDQALCEPLAAR